MTGWPEYLLVALAGIAAGALNALAGGGTLISFPALTAIGIPAVAANVTSTVALCPGYLGATLAQARDMRGQAARLRLTLPAGILGGVAGGLLLLRTGERSFRAAVPYLILLASVLLAAQERLRLRIAARLAAGQRNDGAVAVKARSTKPSGWTALPVGLAAIYGGYFGAGVSVIVLAVLGVTLEDSLTRLNALKQAIAFSVNVAAALLFVFSRQVEWPAALVMAVAALLGGAVGGRFAGRVRPATLRRVVVVIGVVVAIIYLAP
jgi:uncharacterized membrane protein YfcA